MHGRYAVVFRAGGTQAAGRLEIERDRLLLCGRTKDEDLKVEIPFSDLVEVRVGRLPNERLNGYRTVVLESVTAPAVRVAPLGVAQLSEIVDLLVSLSGRVGGSVLTIWVPLKPGCLARVRKLLAQGPLLDPGSLGLTGHEVYLHEDEAIFVFRGPDVRTQVGRAIRHPAIWRAGLAWQRCFAGPPQLVDDASLLNFDPVPAYSWEAP